VEGERRGGEERWVRARVRDREGGGEIGRESVVHLQPLLQPYCFLYMLPPEFEPFASPQGYLAVHVDAVAPVGPMLPEVMRLLRQEHHSCRVPVFFRAVHQLVLW
jgi:hypothetical protein